MKKALFGGVAGLALLGMTLVPLGGTGTVEAVANPNASCAGAAASNQQTPGDASGAWSSLPGITKSAFGRLGNLFDPGSTSGAMTAVIVTCSIQG